jgi:hypothetical protein
MEMLFESEKNLATTYYMPISLLTYMYKKFPILMWADMFETSPKFAHLYAPPAVVLAIELFLRGGRSPWKRAKELAIENEKQRLAPMETIHLRSQRRNPDVTVRQMGHKVLRHGLRPTCSRTGRLLDKHGRGGLLTHPLKPNRSGGKGMT